MKVVIAPDKFKGSLTAAEAAQAMRLGVLDAEPDARVTCLPVADGGEGTADAFVSAGADPHDVTVKGPLGRDTTARVAMRGDLGVVETAQACGLPLIADPGPETALAADTGGVADLIRAASRARRIVLGLGGSASTDGGSGLARGLGARLLDAAGRDLPPGGGALATLDRIDLSGFAPVEAEVLAACDVLVPLLDAARVFAGQKGAGPDEIALLEAGLARWAEVVERDVGRPIADLAGGGAAGGLGAGAVAFLDARIVSGVDVVLDLVGFADAVRDADAVLTGEGSFDEQSLTGKAPIGVARAAPGVPVWLIAGRASVQAPEFAGALALTDIATLDEAIRDASALVRRQAARAIHRIAQGLAG